MKDSSKFKLIGTNAKRLDTPSKVNGSAVFGIDIKIPGMKIGTLAITPVKGGKLVSLDEDAARKVPGVHDIVRAGDDAVAVIGDHMWAAKQGLEALNPVWDAGPNGQGHASRHYSGNAGRLAEQGSGGQAAGRCRGRDRRRRHQAQRHLPVTVPVAFPDGAFELHAAHPA